MNTNQIIALSVTAAAVVIGTVAFFAWPEKKDEAVQETVCPHMCYIVTAWTTFETGGKVLDESPKLHAELDAYIRGLTDLTDEELEELHTYNAVKLGANSPI